MIQQLFTHIPVSGQPEAVSVPFTTQNFISDKRSFKLQSDASRNLKRSHSTRLLKSRTGSNNTQFAKRQKILHREQGYYGTELL